MLEPKLLSCNIVGRLFLNLLLVAIGNKIRCAGFVVCRSWFVSCETGVL